MVRIKKEKVLVRPIDIKPTSKDFKVIGTFNPGACRLPNGDIVLYVRVAEQLLKTEDRRYYYSPRCEGKKSCKIKLDKFKRQQVEDKSRADFVLKDGTKRLIFISHLRRVVLSKDGFRVKSIDKKPSFQGLSSDGELGIEDPRITKIGNKYIMTYVTLSVQGNISTSYATSRDCKKWKREGIIFEEQNKDCVIFPGKVRGKYAAFGRPESSFQFSPPHIWVSFSPDLDYWGDFKPIKLSKKGSWDYARVGAGPPPLKTDKGWLLIYHGVTEKKETGPLGFMKKIFGISKKHLVYSVGAALFDLHKPAKLLAKAPKPIIVPRQIYEKFGYFDNIVFPTGIVMDENDKDILLFAGCADRVVSVKKISLKEILSSLEKVCFK